MPRGAGVQTPGAARASRRRQSWSWTASLYFVAGARRGRHAWVRKRSRNVLHRRRARPRSRARSRRRSVRSRNVEPSFSKKPAASACRSSSLGLARQEVVRPRHRRLAGCALRDLLVAPRRNGMACLVRVTKRATSAMSSGQRADDADRPRRASAPRDRAGPCRRRTALLLAELGDLLRNISASSCASKQGERCGTGGCSPQEAGVDLFGACRPAALYQRLGALLLRARPIANVDQRQGEDERDDEPDRVPERRDAARRRN